MLCSPPPATTLASSCVGSDGFCAPCCRRSSQRSRIHNRPKTGRTLLLHERRINQRQLASALGLTFQQLHKYEQGKSRISAGRLYELGKVLGVPITFFVEDIADTLTPVTLLETGDHTDELGRREAGELFAAYRAISDPLLRLSVRRLARALAPEPNGSTAKASASQRRART